MSDRSDFSELYHSGTAKGSTSLDPCVGKKNADCVGSCHLEVSEYKPNELKHISRDQQMENLQYQFYYYANFLSSQNQQ